MSKPKLGIVIGSIRTNRFGGHAAQSIEEIVRRRTDFEVELIHPKDYPMPLFAEEVSPLYAPSKNEVAQRWQKKVGEFDAFIFTAAEYNRGPTAVLKNALDYAYAEWSNKPAAFVGYGGVGGARAVEQLRLHAIELQMAPIRNAVHILFPDYLAVIKDGKPLSELGISIKPPGRCSIRWHGGLPPSKPRGRRVCARRPSRKKPMTITLNHTIVWVATRSASRFFAGIFGLRFEGSGGHFAPVRVNDTLTLDFADAKGTIAGHIMRFISEPNSDAILQRVKDAELTFGAAPGALKTESSTIEMAAAASITRTTTAMSSS